VTASTGNGVFFSSGAPLTLPPFILIFYRGSACAALVRMRASAWDVTPVN
jgi:hypothetical protein